MPRIITHFRIYLSTNRVHLNLHISRNQKHYWQKINETNNTRGYFPLNKTVLGIRMIYLNSIDKNIDNFSSNNWPFRCYAHWVGSSDGAVDNIYRLSLFLPNFFSSRVSSRCYFLFIFFTWNVLEEVTVACIAVSLEMRRGGIVGCQSNPEEKWNERRGMWSWRVSLWQQQRR